MAAALLNSTFIQGFELDDFHGDAPLHSNSVLLPALFAAAQHTSTETSTPIDGPSFLLATIVGYETGPRVGLGLYGAHMLSRGWHSGAVFGPVASAASVSKLLKLTPDLVEDAMGMAATQACGLMSAQYESMVKRMQHGFAARNGLFASFLAQNKYKGIERVFERPYGGFLAAFGQGSGRTPEYRADEVAKGLGETWQVGGIRIKPYAALASTHSSIDCIRVLQAKYPAKFALENLHNITTITIDLATSSYKHGGWEPERPLTVTGAQMSVKYVVACQLVDRQVLPSQFSQKNLDRDILWEIINKINTVNDVAFDGPTSDQRWQHRINVEFADGSSVRYLNPSPKGVNPPLTNQEILDKYRLMTAEVIDQDRQKAIEELVLGIDSLTDVARLISLLSPITKDPIA